MRHIVEALLVGAALAYGSTDLDSAKKECPSIACEGTVANGRDAVAMGFATTASGLNSVALGFDTTASGNMATAMGANTTARGDFGTALGWATVAECGGSEPTNNGACVAMGFNTVNKEPESLAVSGNVHARNVKVFGADARLAQNATAVDSSTLLANVERLHVVAHSPSDAFCKHQGRRPSQCAADVRVGLLAQQVAAVIPAAVGSGASLTLVDAATGRTGHLAPGAERAAMRIGPGSVLEELGALQGLDVDAMLAQLVGAVQALSKQNQLLLQRVAALETSHK